MTYQDAREQCWHAGLPLVSTFDNFTITMATHLVMRKGLTSVWVSVKKKDFGTLEQVNGEKYNKCKK